MKKISLLISALALSLSSMAQSLVAHYDFTNAASSGIATDPVNSLNGAVFGGVDAAGKCGVPGTAMKFNGTTDYVAVPANSLLNLTKWTIQAVVYIDGFETSLDCQVDKILQHGNQYGNNYYALEINDNNDDPTNGYELNYCNSPVDVNNMRFFGAAAGAISPIGAPSSTVSLGQWYCLTAVYDGGTMKYYVNGVLNYTKAWPNGYSYGGNIAQLLIGMGTGSGGTTYHFNGKIDDVKLYDGPLSAAEVGDLCYTCPDPCIQDIGYCSQLSTPFTYTFTPNLSVPTDCVQWNFGDGSGTITSGPGGAITHTFPAGGGSYQICAVEINCKTRVACPREKCFTMCLNGMSGAKSSNENSGGTKTRIGNYENGIGTLYPNPANSELNIPVQGLKGTITISVIGIDGKRISSKTMTASEATSMLQYNTAELKTGTYMLEITTGGQKIVKRFSKL